MAAKKNKRAALRIIKKIAAEPVAKVSSVVRQAHHELKKLNDSKTTSVPELVEG